MSTGARMTLRIVLADDEPLARLALRASLAPMPDCVVVAEATHGAEAVTVVRREQPDLLLLDIQMPELDGFGVLEQLGADLPPAIVFVTAYDAHAIRAFQEHAVDYLLKPFDDARLAIAIDRARLRVQSAPVSSDIVADRLERLLAALTPPQPLLERFVVRVGARSVIVPVADVDWIEAADNYACLHVGTARHFIRETMRALDTRLDTQQFARIHRSTIVNLRRVRELKALPSGDYEVLLTSGTKLTLSRSWRDSFEQRLGSPL